MKFSAVIVAAIAASSAVDVAAFGVHNPLNVGHSRTVASSSLNMSLEDLEKSVLTEKTAPKAKEQKVKEPKPPKEPRQPRKKASKPEPAPVVVAEPEPVPEPAPTKKGRGKKSGAYDLDDFKTEKKSVTIKSAAPIAPKPKPEKVAPAPKFARPDRKKVEKAVAPPKPPVEKDPNAGVVGLALGAAPLVAAPVFALTAARGALSKTAARRQEIQDRIDAEAAAKAAAKAAAVNTEVDGGEIFKAVAFLGGAAGALGFSVISSLTGSGLIESPTPAASSTVKTAKPASTPAAKSFSPPKMNIIGSPSSSSKLPKE